MKRDLAELLTKVIDYKLASIHVGCPATVVAYYPANPPGVPVATVDVTIPVSRVIDLDEGPLVETLPELFNVPVEFPRGGGFAIIWPLLPGDTGELSFQDFSIDAWRSNGLAGAPLADYRAHSIGSAVFRPGLSPNSNPLAAAPSATGMQLGQESGQQIVITPAGVLVGSPSATKGAARVGDAVQVTIPINSITLAVSGASATGPAAPLNLNGTIQAGSTTVKVED